MTQLSTMVPVAALWILMGLRTKTVLGANDMLALPLNTPNPCDAKACCPGSDSWYVTVPLLTDPPSLVQAVWP